METFKFDGKTYVYAELTDEQKLHVEQLAVLKQELRETQLKADRILAATHEFERRFRELIAPPEPKENV